MTSLAALLRSPMDLRAMAPMLPRRVLAAVAAEQVTSERLIGWAQLGVVATLGLFYYAAPKPDFFDYYFSPLPYALAAYAAFTLGRLHLSYRVTLPRWFLLLSIVVDMGLMLGTIWSIHLQYDQPAAFYLKAPAYAYLFIFIALRALRFEALYVVLAGVVAAGGWLLLTFYAAWTGPSGQTMTNDFVTYLTTSVILWTAEADRVVALLVVTAVLALALARGQRMLVRAVAEETAARDLKRFFDRDVAQRITGADHAIRPGEGEIRDAATLFVDLRGFTPLSNRLSPDALIALLSDYQKRMVAAIQREGGVIDKFLGDGIMASFGASMPNRTYAADALRAVDAVMVEAQQWRNERDALGLPTPAVGAAVAVGPVLFGAVGDENRLEYTVIGDTVNLAAKLEKQTKTEKVAALTTADALRLALAQGYAPASEKALRPAIRVSGVADPVDLAVLA